MEGQATWLMSEFLARKLGQSLKDSPAMVAAMSAMSESGSGQFPVFESAPLYLRLTLVFPYTKGMLFQHAVQTRDGQHAFPGVFSAAADLHPADHSSGKVFREREAHHAGSSRSPACRRATRAWSAACWESWSTPFCCSRSMGKEPAADLASHWRGSSFELVEDKKTRRAVLLYASEWDSEDTARQYLHGLSR